MRSHKRWTSIEIRPDAPATVDYNPLDQCYWLTWEAIGLAIGLTEAELRSIVADAMIAQAATAMTSDAS